MQKKVVIILIIISFILIIVGGVFLFIDNDKKEENTNSNKDVEIKEEIKKTILSEDDFGKYKKDIDLNVMYFDSLLSDKYPIKDFNKLSDKEKTLFLVGTMVTFKKKEVSIDELNKIKGNYFKDFNLVLEDLKDGDQVLYKYEDNKFIYNGSSDKSCLAVTKKIIENGYEEFWEIENILYYVSEKSSNGSTYNVIYSNLNDCKSESDELYRYSSKNGVFSDNEFDKIKDDLDTYIYKFDRVEDKYLIKSITLK